MGWEVGRGLLGAEICGAEICVGPIVSILTADLSHTLSIYLSSFCAAL